MKQVLIADDLAIVRFGAGNLLHEQFPGTTVKFAVNTHELIEKISHAKFDLLILGINLRTANFPEFLSIIKHKQPEIKILLLSGKLKKKEIARFTVAGANGILLQSESERKLKAAIVCIFDGATYLSNNLSIII